jgi:hypothetical protein
VYQLRCGSGSNRYHFDFGPCSGNGWRQYDTKQDASYFGVWVHIEKRMTVTFSEGDLSVVVCPTIETFRAELEDAAKTYGDPPPAFKAIADDGTVTHYFDERPTV